VQAKRSYLTCVGSLGLAHRSMRRSVGVSDARSQMYELTAYYAPNSPLASVKRTRAVQRHA